MIPLEIGKLESIERFTSLPGWEAVREFAQIKIDRHERSLTRLIFNTSSPVDPTRVEYDRGFKQGVMYVLDALPREAQVALHKAIADKDGDE